MQFHFYGGTSVVQKYLPLPNDGGYECSIVISLGERWIGVVGPRAETGCVLCGWGPRSTVGGARAQVLTSLALVGAS